MSKKLKVGERVQRRQGDGPRGTVSKIRIETMRTSLKENTEGLEGPAITVTVMWDNGTTSHFIPEGLDRVKAGK